MSQHSPCPLEPGRSTSPEEKRLSLRGFEEVSCAEKGLSLQPDERFNQRRGFWTAFFWMAVNTLATVGIVFTNKVIFLDPTWKFSQLTFASFHFLVTWFTLLVLSMPAFDYFVLRRAPILHLMPLAAAMCLNVILPNLSLAFSSVTFYQLARIMLTPVVAYLNYVLYGATLPLAAIVVLIPACLGVGIVSYYDSIPASGNNVETTAPLGVAFAFIGIMASSFYTVWIASYHKKLHMSSMQLLYNQAPIASFMLLYAVPFLDDLPQWSQVTATKLFLIALSGLLASLINISQFFIIAQTGPVSSTVVGHVKTCAIVCLGWVTSGRSTNDRALVGVCLAVAAIVAYSIVMLEHNARRVLSAKRQDK
ncbi:hypothetical protein HIM_04547 [Hirsutella minnesotensis 3608]|uniref:GDP-mannose transporter n=1 Tax=Hirsutella minnesotensis 3608 TaxID=1043627 RepID=A0A0F7ZL78_9HYPO|nr:hypothetical protein HIM_04547 [Hirsutella minnesotensis 3608]